MALTLLEYAKQATNPLDAGVVQTYIEAHPLLEFLPFLQIPGQSKNGNYEQELPDIATRAINAGYTADEGIVGPYNDPLAILGGDLDVDNFLMKTDPSGSIRSSRIAMKVKHAAHYFANLVINGDNISDNTQFNGIKVRAVSSTQLIDAGSASGGNALSLNVLDNAISNVMQPSAIICSEALKNLFAHAARTTTVGGNIQFSKTELGSSIMRYNDLPTIPIGSAGHYYNSLPFTEANPGGGTAASTSLFIVSFEDDGLNGIMTGPPNGRDLGEIDASPVYRFRLEWFAAITMGRPNALVRVRGIKNAAFIA